MREVYEQLSEKIRVDAIEKFQMSAEALTRDFANTDADSLSTAANNLTRMTAKQLRASGALLLEALEDVHIAEGPRQLDKREEDLQSMFARELHSLAQQLTLRRDERVVALSGAASEGVFIPNFNDAIQSIQQEAFAKIDKLIAQARLAKHLNGVSSQFGMR